MTATIDLAPEVSASEVTREMGIQLGFAWHCAAGECDTNGCDRGEYAAHMKGHGKRPLTPSVKPVKLRNARPVAKFPQLEVSVFKFLAWTQEHTPTMTCQCGHQVDHTHRLEYGRDGGHRWACSECDCRHDGDGFIRHATQTAERCGQFLSEGPYPHSVWVIPFEPAPWEGDRAAPVTLFVIEPGRYSATYSKYERREAQRRIKARKVA